MHETSEFSKAQIERIETFCRELENVGPHSTPRLMIEQWVEEGQWGTRLSVRIGNDNVTRRNNRFTTAPYPRMEFSAASKPWSTWDTDKRTAQEAYIFLWEQLRNTAQREMNNIDEEITHLRARRLQLERAIDAFAVSGGWGR